MMVISAQTASNIQKWNQVQEELKEDPTAVPRIQIGTPSTEAANAHLPISQVSTSQPSTISNGPSTATTPEPVEAELEFSDTNAMTCLLCARQFKNMDQLKRHNKESDLHKARLSIPLRVLAYQMELMAVLFFFSFYFVFLCTLS